MPAQALLVGILAAVLLLAGLIGLLLVRLRPQDDGQTTALTRLEARVSDLGDAVARLNDLVHTSQNAGTKAFGEFSERLGERQESLKRDVRTDLTQGQQSTQAALHDFEKRFTEVLNEQKVGLEQRHTQTLETQRKALADGLESVRTELSRALSEHLKKHSETLGTEIKGLSTMTDQRLKEIGGKVDTRLSEGFEKTNATFTDIVKRLAMIDQAQQKITELSTNVVSLQSILADKKSRGAFGEVQLEGLVRNVLPESSFQMQYTLSNGRIADCMVFLPEPTGNIAIDAKFPLEAFARMTDHQAAESDRKQAERQFKQDIKRHVTDISERYILSGETAEGAMMFIPAEAVFAEIQAHHRELVEEAHRRRVWMVSPTTLWAVLNTSRAVLKDAATREQVHLIQDHLRALSKDFGRFRERMEKLATHISQANEDVRQVSISARKIGSRFDKIEDVELERLPGEAVPADTAVGDLFGPDEELDTDEQD